MSFTWSRQSAQSFPPGHFADHDGSNAGSLPGRLRAMAVRRGAIGPRRRSGDSSPLAEVDTLMAQAHALVRKESDPRTPATDSECFDSGDTVRRLEDLLAALEGRLRIAEATV